MICADVLGELMVRKYELQELTETTYALRNNWHYLTGIIMIRIIFGIQLPM